MSEKYSKNWSQQKFISYTQGYLYRLCNFTTSNSSKCTQQLKQTSAWARSKPSKQQPRASTQAQLLCQP
jgi:hypothetical protein